MDSTPPCSLVKTDAATLKRVYAMSLAGVYPHYVAKAEKKGRTIRRARW
jgi:hypothetical protein